MANYWTNVMHQRLSRRRAIAMTGGAAAGAALMAACGGSDDSSSNSSGSNSSVTGGTPITKDTSGLLTVMQDESKSVKRGGRYVGLHPGVILTWDPFKTGINIRGGRRGFSQLFRISDGILENTKGTIEGDLAQSWELSPDKLTLTAHLDPGAGLPPIAPVNGRVIDAQDVVFSWERMKKQGAFRTELANELNPGAPITSITAPDAKTVVIKMSEPNATVLSLLGTDALGYLFIQPKEAGDKWDPDKTAIGSGPFYVTDTSEVSYTWKRNPNFKRAKLTNGEPYLDEIFEPVIPDTATATAQLRTGAVYLYTPPTGDAIVATKKDIKDLIMFATSPAITGTERVYFGQNDDSIFKDERVRIAYMKCIDRDSFIVAAHSTDRFEKEGLPVSEFWEAGLGAGTWTGWYADPKSKDFGENAKNYVFDLAEAKKMVEAAGLKTPVDARLVYAQPSPTSFPPSFYTRAEIFMGMWENSGVFKVRRDLITYQDWNTEKVRFSGGKFTGVTWGPDTATGDPAANIFFLYNSKGGYFEGGDATIDDMTAKARAEFDDAKRKQMVIDIQKYNGAHFYQNKIGTAGSFNLQWPVVRNNNPAVFRGGTNWMDMRTFIDPSQAPLKK